MKYIECKAQWHARALTTKTSMSGFEGPASKTELDDGFGIPTLKGMVTSAYACWFEETGRENNCPVYDGTINIPDTKANRYKIAQHVRSRDLRVKDRNLERQILADNPKVAREKRPRNVQHFVDMPEDFDGSKVVLRSGSMAIVDQDPIEDVHAQVSDAEFTEVKEQTQAAPEKETAVKLVAPTVSVAHAQLGGIPKPVTEPPKGFDPKALKARAEAAKAAEKAPEAKTEETPAAEADKAKE